MRAATATPQTLQDRMDGVSAAVRAGLDCLAGLPDNWDEDGGKPYPRRQLSRVEAWWEDFVKEYHGEFSMLPPVPGIGQADKQSIDIFWDGDFSLLVNIPEDESEPCAFYGSRAAGSGAEFQGTQPLESLGNSIKGIVKDYCG